MSLPIRRLLAALSAMLLLFGWSAAGAAARPGDAASYRVVFQVTAENPEQWNGLLGNIENLRRSLGDELSQVEVIAHGKGIGLVLRSNTAYASRMDALSKQGVRFIGCENTIRARGLTKADLLPFVDTVDSGVAQVVRRQKQGWQYIRIGQ